MRDVLISMVGCFVICNKAKDGTIRILIMMFVYIQWFVWIINIILTVQLYQYSKFAVAACTQNTRKILFSALLIFLLLKPVYFFHVNG